MATWSCQSVRVRRKKRRFHEVVALLASRAPADKAKNHDVSQMVHGSIYKDECIEGSLQERWHDHDDDVKEEEISPHHHASFMIIIIIR
jgi:hypothetical protein